MIEILTEWYFEDGLFFLKKNFDKRSQAYLG